jgi:hypothetical protein
MPPATLIPGPIFPDAGGAGGSDSSIPPGTDGTEAGGAGAASTGSPPLPPDVASPFPQGAQAQPPEVPPLQSGQLWLVIFRPIQTYSLAMDPLWTATPGEWYVVLAREDGWALAQWEGDQPEWVEWIEEGPAFDYTVI